MDAWDGGGGKSTSLVVGTTEGVVMIADQRQAIDFMNMKKNKYSKGSK